MQIVRISALKYSFFAMFTFLQSIEYHKIHICQDQGRGIYSRSLLGQIRNVDIASLSLIYLQWNMPAHRIMHYNYIRLVQAYLFSSTSELIRTCIVSATQFILAHRTIPSTITNTSYRNTICIRAFIHTSTYYVFAALKMHAIFAVQNRPISPKIINAGDISVIACCTIPF